MTRSFLSLFIFLAFGAFVTVSAKPRDAGNKHVSVLARPCTGARLWVGVDKDFQGDAAMGGQRGDQFLVKNISRSTCTISGTPGIVLVDRRGRMMGRAIRPKRGGATTLKPGGKATFEIGYHSCVFIAGASDRNPKNCRWSVRAQIRFSGVQRVFTVNEKIDAEGGVEQVMPLETK